MSDTDGMGFGKFVPGFDFLQGLAKGASQTIPQMPNLANWVSPSLNVEELEKRIEELRAVHFWLEQNSRALGATIQALEVQKMTLATLKGMNFNLGDVANAFKLKAADSVASGMEKASERASSTAKSLTDAASAVGGVARKVAGGKSKSAAATSLVDPLNLWSALTQQFQQIAAGAMQEATRKTAVDATRNMAAGLARETVKAGKKASAARKRKSAAKSVSRGQ
ncbi:MAG: hypothetical protein KBF63_05415 [Rhodoferax sp.]|jgi:hypothetical protein|nr:hypothetical protein [Rhodoferax sp.]MBP9928696.1 hypothetical protein [Rhodoferax sp.]HQX59611.1 hypothetical protein [Burkholderiaceae bacterium]HQZ05170.1 hypothetical protein [Burkholderiaceae bacterium]HRA61324.1 hypothetical protein [Burkholderiaceae bacterium]